MELSQMSVQGLWDRDHTLLQIPHFTKEIVERCEASGEEIETVFDILGLDDDVREGLLQLPPHKMNDVAAFCNNYPNIDLNYELVDADSVTTGDAVNIVVTLEREVDEDGMDEGKGFGNVIAPSYPKPKVEGWWLVVGDVGRNVLMSIKRLTLQQRARVKLDFVAPDTPGEYNLVLYLMSDSYMGCDQEYEMKLVVAEGDDDDDDDDDDDLDD
jgi:pre-mRNA-splicing helicase BRR2